MVFDLGLGSKAAFVTGGASGIGAEICRRLAAEGARVAIADRDIDAARALAQTLEGGALAVALDVTDPGACRGAVEQAAAAFGALHLAVNSAGIVTPRAPLADQGDGDWARCLAVNLTGVFNALRAEIPAILAAGGGAIVNVASISGVVAVAGTAAYAAAKHGVIGLTRAAALDYAEAGLRVNAVAPGYVDTPLLAARSADEMADIRRRHPMNRLATPGEVADCALFLLSDRAGFVTGSVQMVDGGYAAR